ncbi:MAG: GIY-YIG nuclease family protein [Candidatus Omnitrophica bacterium]|nr:GIY-YIG nuclease family protein [Candidatus Omnitrophota bacterium]
MEELERDKKRQPGQPWFLYILRCQDDTFYTGVTKDLERRLKMHNEGKASRYTRVRRPVTLIYHEDCASRAQALVLECQVKALSREEKARLILNGRKSIKRGRKSHGKHI